MRILYDWFIFLENYTAMLKKLDSILSQYSEIEQENVGVMSTTRGDLSTGKTVTKGLQLCKGCNEEFTPDAYLDHVYDRPECYRQFLASEKKEMSKQ